MSPARRLRSLPGRLESPRRVPSCDRQRQCRSAMAVAVRIPLPGAGSSAATNLDQSAPVLLADPTGGGITYAEVFGAVPNLNELLTDTRHSCECRASKPFARSPSIRLRRRPFVRHASSPPAVPESNDSSSESKSTLSCTTCASAGPLRKWNPRAGHAPKVQPCRVRSRPPRRIQFANGAGLASAG